MYVTNTAIRNFRLTKILLDPHWQNYNVFCECLMEKYKLFNLLLIIVPGHHRGADREHNI